MEIQSYNAELAIANLMFLRIFNNIHLQKIQKNNLKKDVLVKCVFGQRSRILKNWENAEKRGIFTLPIIAINRTGFSRNSERLNNLHNEIKYEVSSKKTIYDLLTPVPIDISYEVSILAKYPSDIDQIASNFMVFFNNDIYVTCEHPKYIGIKLNNQIIMDDSISEEHSDEIDANLDDIITTTFNFTFKTYLFGGNKQATLFNKNPDDNNDNSDLVPIDPDNKPDNTDGPIYDGFVPIIKTIDFSIYPVPYKYETFRSYLDYIDPRLADPDDLGKDPDPYVDRLVWTINEKNN